MAEKAKSKFEQKMLARMDAKTDNEKVAERSYRKATNIVKQQISALEVKRTDLEIKQEEAQEALEDATYTENFSIAKYDAAKAHADEVEEELSDVEKTLQARKELLEAFE